MISGNDVNRADMKSNGKYIVSVSVTYNGNTYSKNGMTIQV
jgi:hypothetical protein